MVFDWDEFWLLIDLWVVCELYLECFDIQGMIDVMIYLVILIVIDFIESEFGWVVVCMVMVEIVDVGVEFIVEVLCLYGDEDLFILFFLFVLLMWFVCFFFGFGVICEEVDVLCMDLFDEVGVEIVFMSFCGVGYFCFLVYFYMEVFDFEVFVECCVFQILSCVGIFCVDFFIFF